LIKRLLKKTDNKHLNRDIHLRVSVEVEPMVVVTTAIIKKRANLSMLILTLINLTI
jgi:hypothetical protein